MALRGGGVIQDQNFNLHHSGTAIGGKADERGSKKKGRLGGRKPLGDLSNSEKPIPNHASIKPTAKIFRVEDQANDGSKITKNARKKNTSKALEGGQNVTRRALSDISNSGKPDMLGALKKKQNMKLHAVNDDAFHHSIIAEEQFLHNHQECIKDRNKMGLNQFFETVGLDICNPKELLSPVAAPAPASVLCKLKPETTVILECGEETSEPIILREEKLYSSPPCWTPESPKYIRQWKDSDSINFRLMETPGLPKL